MPTTVEREVGRGTYRVPEPNLPKLEAVLGALNKRATKLHTEPIRWTVGAPETVIDRVPHPVLGSVERVRVYRAVTVEGAVPVLAGWTFLATLDHTGGDLGVMLRVVPGVTDLPVAYRTAGPTCDHCGLDRRRNETFVLRHADGRYAKVGRTCLGDFLGHEDPHAVAAAAEWLATVHATATDSEDEGWGGGGGLHYVGLATYLTSVNAAVTKWGWVSRKAAESGRCATADAVLIALEDERHGTKIPEKDRLTTTPEDVAAATDAIEWARALRASKPELSDYEHNLVVATAGDVVPVKWAGVVASLIPTWRREIGREIERAKLAATSAHVGTVGKRETFRLTLVSERSFETAYGVTTLYLWADPAGNRLKWFSSRNLRLTAGATYAVKATVKGHEAYKGVPETIITRAVVDPASSPALMEAA